MRPRKWISNLYDAALALVYPQDCAVCGKNVEARANAPACTSCWESTPIFTGKETICWKCGAQAQTRLISENLPDVRCRRCDEESFTAARSIGLYEGALRAAVLALKREPHISAHLAQLLFEAQRRPPLGSATRIVPVPLHPERQRERGFNQAEGLARVLARHTRLPLDEWSVIRIVHSERHRAGMDVQGRRETVRNAFRVVRPRLVEGERILLIDDVFTTGATVSACARALLEAGAQEIFVLTVARA